MSYLSISEAAKLVGKTESTVRKVVIAEFKKGTDNVKQQAVGRRNYYMVKEAFVRERYPVADTTRDQLRELQAANEKLQKENESLRAEKKDLYELLKGEQQKEIIRQRSELTRLQGLLMEKGLFPSGGNDEK